MLVTDLKIGGYRFGSKTFYAAKHRGIDLKADYVRINFPVDLYDCKSSTNNGGGLTFYGTDKSGYVHRLMHLSKVPWQGTLVKAYADFATTGNSGKYTTGPHLHWDIRKPNTSSLAFGNFIDPEVWKKTVLPNLLKMELQEWQKSFIKEAIEKGISTGENPLDNLTRVECMGMVLKGIQYIEKKYNLK